MLCRHFVGNLLLNIPKIKKMELFPYIRTQRRQLFYLIPHVPGRYGYCPELLPGPSGSSWISGTVGCPTAGYRARIKLKQKFKNGCIDKFVKRFRKDFAIKFEMDAFLEFVEKFLIF